MYISWIDIQDTSSLVLVVVAVSIQAIYIIYMYIPLTAAPAVSVKLARKN